MNRGNHLIRNHSKNLPLFQSERENHPKNQNLKQKKIQPSKIPSQSLHASIKIDSLPLTSYRMKCTAQQREEKKWQLLSRFQHLASKAHYVHNLKFQTLFLSYSLAQKTVSLVIDQQVTYQYWVVCCLFMSMKYEEIYPPRLRDLSMLIKQAIKPEEYNESELKILQFIGLDLNFVSINTFLSEFLHAVTERQRYFIFYFLEISLGLRSQLRKFELKEIVLSVMFLLSSHRLHFYAEQKINGVEFERIQECSKYIIVSQTSAVQRFPFLFKKYRSQRMKSVACESIPTVESLTALLVKKTDSETTTPKIVGFCQDPDENNIEQESDTIVALINKRFGEEEKPRKPRY